MSRWFELWDADNASLVGTFDTQAEALHVVRRSLASFGPGSVVSLVLTEEDESDADPRVIAAGAELAALAQEQDGSLAGVAAGKAADGGRKVG
jgi:hypothetical protein